MDHHYESSQDAENGHNAIRLDPWNHRKSYRKRDEIFDQQENLKASILVHLVAPGGGVELTMIVSMATG